MLSRCAARAARLPGVAAALAALAASRWYLLLRTIPYALAASAARFLLVDLFGLAFFSKDLVNAFSQSAIFVVAILLSGVLEDYKEAEALPCTIAAEFEGAADRVAFAAAAGGAALDAPAARGELQAALEAVLAFLAGADGGAGGADAVQAAVGERFRHVALALARAGAGDGAAAVLAHAHDVRKALGRLYVIKRTDFLQSGAALMELLVNSTVALTVLCTDGGDGILASHALTLFNAFQFFYVRLHETRRRAFCARARARANPLPAPLPSGFGAPGGY
jgi:hypothetical protein